MPFSTMSATVAAIILAFATKNMAIYIECDGQFSPVWTDCDVIAYNAFDGSTDHDEPCTGCDPTKPLPNGWPDATIIAPPEGVDPTSLNCVISFIPADDSQVVLSTDINIAYADLQLCRNEGQAAGTDFANDDKTGLQVAVYNNPEYVPPSSKRNSLPRNHARGFTKRQEKDDDDYKLFELAKNIAIIQKRVLVAGPIGPEDMFMTSNTTTQTTGISASVEAGADFFEIFSASVSITTSYDYSVASSVGVTVNCMCADDQMCDVYFQPLYDIYYGNYEPSGDECNWMIPVATQDSFTTECIAKP